MANVPRSKRALFILEKVHTRAKKTTKVPKKGPKRTEKCHKGGFHSIGATICTYQEILCLPYACFFKPLYIDKKKQTPIWITNKKQTFFESTL